MAQPKAIPNSNNEVSKLPQLYNRLLLNIQLARNTDDLFKRVLPILGNTIDSHRSYAFRYVNGKSQVSRAFLVNQWVAGGFDLKNGHSINDGVDVTPYEEINKTLAQGRIYYSLVDDLVDETLKSYLRAEEVVSFIFTPIIIDDNLWGVIGFDDCKIAREWGESEKELIQFASKLISFGLKNLELNTSLNQRNNQLEVALESSNDGVWEIDLKLNKIYFSDQWMFLLGYQKTNLPNNLEEFEQLVHPEDRDRFLANIDPFKKGNPSLLECEYRIKNAQGKYKWLQTQAVISRNQYGYPVAIKANSVDITARLTYKANIEKKEEEYKALVESIQDVIFRLDSDYNLEFVNAAWTNITGFDVEKSIGVNFEQFIHPDDKHKLNIHEDTINDFEFRLLKSNGRFCWVKCYAEKHYENKNLSGISGNITHIHQRKMAELALRESEQRFRLMGENMNDLVCMHQTEGKLIYVSPSVYELLGYQPEEVMDKQSYEFVVAEDMDHIRQNMRGFLYGNEKIQKMYVVRLLTKEGEAVWFETIIQPIYKEGELTSYLSVSRDITERKEVEEEMEKALLKEREVSDLRSRFISMASHEFRTPLASIKSSVDLLDLYVEDSDHRELAPFGRHFQKIRDQIDRLTNMMNDVLVLGKSEADKIAVTYEETDLIELSLAFIDQNFLNREDGRTISLEFTGNRKQVWVDQTLITHILDNLISNAFKYSEDSQSPELVLDFQEEAFVIKVKDYGIGIPKEEQNQLFQSFFRAKNTIGIDGTGLGLVIAKQFIEAHKGTIEIVSETGKFTEVKVTIPYLDPTSLDAE